MAIRGVFSAATMRSIIRLPARSRSGLSPPPMRRAAPPARMTAGGWSGATAQGFGNDSSELNRLSERIIGCAFTVANTLGAGFLDKVYENAPAHELRKAGLMVAR